MSARNKGWWLLPVAGIVLTGLFVLDEKSPIPDRAVFVEHETRAMLEHYNVRHGTAHPHVNVQYRHLDGTVATMLWAELTIDIEYLNSNTEEALRERVAHELAHYVVGREHARDSLHADDGSIEFQRTKAELLRP